MTQERLIEQGSRLSELEARLTEIESRTGFRAWLWASSTLDSVVEGAARGPVALAQGGRWLCSGVSQVVEHS